MFKEKKIENIKILIEEQTKILNEIRNTKAYKLIESYHFWKEKKGIKKVQNARRVWKHICGQPDEKIKVHDPMEAVFRLQDEMESQLEQVEVKLDGYIEGIHILQKILEAKISGYRVICIFAPYEEMNKPDGYFRRVKNIDDLLGEQTVRVYISKIVGSDERFPICSMQKENYFTVKYDAFNQKQCAFVEILVHLTEMAYIHSVYQAFLPVMRDEQVTKLYDFHGVVPEELSFMDKNEEAEFYSKQEAELVERADYIIVANYAMKKHIESKYPECSAEFIVMPMNNDDNNYYVNNEEKKDERIIKPIVIYSGGLQKWQMISEMQDAIEMMRDKCEFHLFVSEPNEFMKLWGNREFPESWEVTTKSPEELMEEYVFAQYGFVLREDLVVNNVACPTKIIDYIKYNIIPIMKTPNIGDFQKYGLHYLSIDDFLSGKFPSKGERVEMCKRNQEILSKILEEYQVGRKKIENILLK